MRVAIPSRFPPELQELAEFLGRVEGLPDWEGADPNELDRLIRLALPACRGVLNPQVGEVVAKLYSEYRGTAPLETRAALLRDIELQTSKGEADVAALLPFVMHEREPSLVAAAAQGAVLFDPLSAEAPQVVVTGLLQHLMYSPVEARGGVLGGLLNLGDDRICSTLVRIRRHIPHEDLEITLALLAAPLHAATVEFLVDWLGELDSNRDRERFAVVAGALASAPEIAERAMVVEGRRRLPALADGPIYESGVREIRICDFADRIAPRVRPIALNAHPGVLMQRLLKQWCLTLRGYSC